MGLNVRLCGMKHANEMDPGRRVSHLAAKPESFGARMRALASTCPVKPANHMQKRLHTAHCHVILAKVGAAWQLWTGQSRRLLDHGLHGPAALIQAGTAHGPDPALLGKDFEAKLTSICVA